MIFFFTKFLFNLTGRLACLLSRDVIVDCTRSPGNLESPDHDNRIEQMLPHLLVRQRNSIFLKKRAIASIENVFVYSDRYGHSDLKSD